MGIYAKYRLSAEPPHTCPDVDRAVGAVRDAARILRDIRTEDEDAESAVSDALFQVDGLEDRFEELRTANDAIRRWGAGLESALEDAQAEIDALDEEKAALSRDAEAARDERDDARRLLREAIDRAEEAERRPVRRLLRRVAAAVRNPRARLDFSVKPW